MPTIENVTNPKADDIIIDVRHPDDAEHMSRLHADALSKQGFIKVGVFTPHSN